MRFFENQKTFHPLFTSPKTSRVDGQQPINSFLSNAPDLTIPERGRTGKLSDLNRRLGREANRRKKSARAAIVVTRADFGCRSPLWSLPSDAGVQVAIK